MSSNNDVSLTSDLFWDIKTSNVMRHVNKDETQLQNDKNKQEKEEEFNTDMTIGGKRVKIPLEYQWFVRDIWDIAELHNNEVGKSSCCFSIL
jgi:hypothetical protein